MSYLSIALLADIIIVGVLLLVFVAYSAIKLVDAFWELRRTHEILEADKAERYINGPVNGVDFFEFPED